MPISLCTGVLLELFELSRYSQVVVLTLSGTVVDVWACSGTVDLVAVVLV